MGLAAPLGRAGQDATPCPPPNASIQAVSAGAANPSLLHLDTTTERPGARSPPRPLHSRRTRRESPGVPPGALGGRRRPRGASALRRAGGLDSPARRRPRRGRAGRGRGRHGLPRLRRRDRLPEHRARLPAGRRGDPRAGRPLPAPVLHGRHPTSRTSRSAAGSRELSPCAGEEPAQHPAELGRGGDRERGQDRARRDRPPGRRRLRERLPRPHAADDGHDEQGRPYKRGFGPFPSEVYRAAAPYPYRGIDSDAAIAALEHLFKSGRRPGVRRVRRARDRFRARAASSRCRRDFPARLAEICARHGILYVADEVQSGVGRTGPVWAIEHYDVEPDLLVSGKSLGGGLPLAAVTGRAEMMDAVAPRRARRHVRRQPGRLRRGSRRARHGREAGVPRSRRRSWASSPRARLDEIAAAHPDRSARCAASGRCSRSSSSPTASRRRRRPRSSQVTARRALERGLVLLSCGLYGNVIRLLVPLVVTDADLARGLDILEESLVDASAAAA